MVLLKRFANDFFQRVDDNDDLKGKIVIYKDYRYKSQKEP